MSQSVHINGKPLNKLGGGVQLHQERFDENEGLEVLKNTDSLINVSQTKFNKSLFKSDVLSDGKTVKKYVSDELKKVNEKRVNELGKRAFRKDANVVGVGTFQISDDSLEKLGYVKGKLWEEQTKQARENVTIAYQRMVNNAIKKPDVYGKVLTATLHVDESTPHVDFITCGIDAERPEMSMREILNGPKGSKKGSKLREMQDDLDTIFTDKEKELFLLTRGEPYSQKRDFAKQTKIAMKELDEKEKGLDADREVLKTRGKRLNEKERTLNDKENALEARESAVGDRERAVGVKEAELMQGRSERLREAQSELERVEAEKERLEQENARRRAELARLDRVSLEQRDKLVLEYMKNTVSKSVPGKTLFEVVDGNRQKANDQRLLDRFGNMERESISSKSNNGIGLSY